MGEKKSKISLNEKKVEILSKEKEANIASGAIIAHLDKQTEELQKGLEETERNLRLLL